jgi:hypothetical protein
LTPTRDPPEGSKKDVGTTWRATSTVRAGQYLITRKGLNHATEFGE